MTRLARDEWEAYVPENVGKVRVNHASAVCSGGSPSMIVERKDDGWCSAFCFRCGGSGSYRPDSHYVSPKATTGFGGKHHSVHGYGKEIPEDCTGWGTTPIEVRHWLAKGGVTPAIFIANGCGWSDTRGGLVLPVSKSGHQVGWVERRFNPKWVRNWSFSEDTELFAYVPSVINNTVVIVEDVVSAYRVSDAGFGVIAILGTEMKASVISELLKEKPDEVVVFLDGDNSIVKMKTRVIRKRLDAFVKTRVVEIGKDPKHCTRAELQHLIGVDKPEE